MARFLHEAPQVILRADEPDSGRRDRRGFEAIEFALNTPGPIAAQACSSPILLVSTYSQMSPGRTTGFLAAVPAPG
jgi:hypothetical protein